MIGRPRFQQLNGEDARLLASEAPHARAHATLVHIYDPSTAPGGMVRFKAVLAQIESRLHLAPLFRQKLLHMPMELDRPYWVDDESFDIEAHVTHSALPKPGDWRQFCIMASRIHARVLDMDRSPWEIHVIEGLDMLPGLPPGCFALLTKVHHTLVAMDGSDGITALIHDHTAKVSIPEPPVPWFPRPAPRSGSLYLRPRLGTLRDPPTFAWPVMRAFEGLSSMSRVMAHGLLEAPAATAVTRFNAVVSARRIFETRLFDLETFRRMRELARDAAVNDCLLAVCGGALRRYLQHHGDLPGLDMSALVPFLKVEATDPGSQRHKIGRVRVDLGTTIDNPAKRLAHICAQTSDLRSRAVGARDLIDGEKHSSSATLALSGKVLSMAQSDQRQVAPLANCSIINVPGPSAPLYLVGARLARFTALMPICDGMGLVLAATSYDGGMNISVTSCREQLADPAVFAQCLQESFDEYAAAAGAKRAHSGNRRSARALVK
ncbi:wax ester/triacylglycerol synthase domain-containing protein [Variovorax humicola]|uniref:diacylglycerol O-acyltransferase n=1 Tax=Variovorax humicola TaxID=1769758 RepID=A0ABU8VVL3_9BURK